MRGQFKLIVLLGSLLVFGLTAFNFLVPEQRTFSSFFSYISYPVIFLNHKIATFFWQPDWYFNGDLKSENRKLHDLIIDLQAQNIMLTAQSKYWQDHKELIEFNGRHGFANSILAQAFFKNLGKQEHYMLFDKGSLDNVAIDMVAVYQNSLLGKVAAVYPNYCQVDLLTSRTCKIAVYDGKTGAVGICCGKNDSKSISLSYVSHLQKLALGDLLISSGEGVVFPQGFGVGKVANFCENGMYYTAEATLLFDLEDIHSCYLISSNKS